MNKEIEEIIEYFRNDIKWLEEELKNPHYLGYYITIRDKEYEYLKQLLDYITNLQKENKQLTNARYSLDRIELENRNNKAIEYIEDYKHEYYYDLVDKKEVLNILKGEDNVKD